MRMSVLPMIASLGRWQGSRVWFAGRLRGPNLLVAPLGRSEDVLECCARLDSARAARSVLSGYQQGSLCALRAPAAFLSAHEAELPVE